MKTSYELEHCYSAAAGRHDGGVFAAGLCFHDKFEGLRYHRTLNETSYRANRIDFGVWADSFIRTRRELKLITWPDGGEPQCQTLCAAERIDGPVCPKGQTATPAVAWTQRDDAEWTLKLHADSGLRSLHASELPLKNPALCTRGRGYAVACETEARKGGVVSVFDEQGRSLGQFDGRRPVLVEHGGAVRVLVERFVNDAYRLELHTLGQASGNPDCVLAEDSGWYAFNGDMNVDNRSGEIVIAHEVSPKWGRNECNGQYRELKVHRMRLVNGSFSTASVIHHGLEKLEVTAPLSQSITPVRPRLFGTDGRMVLTYKTFALKCDHKQTGWHLWWCEIPAAGKLTPELLSDQLHAMDTGYGVVVGKDELTCALPCLYQQLDWGPSVRHWLCLGVADSAIARPDPADYVVRPFELPASFSNVAERPAALAAEGGRRLLRCDPHVHSQYSKCQSKDGAPDEKIRYQRDVLGMDVLSLADHVPGMSGIEYVWTFDMLEREGGHNGLVLFGNECNNEPGRHTIYYARRRDVFDRFRCSYGSVDHPRRDLTYRFIHDALPEGELLVVRHAHLDSAKQARQDEDTVALNFDSALEVGCEAVQSRGNALMTRILEPEKGCMPFPTHYLDRGYKVGLLGGTDHSNGGAAIHYAFTGLWVERADMQGVWDALKKRRSIAVCNAPIALHAECNGVPMGETVVADGPLRFKIEAACAYGISRVGILRNGEMVVWQDVDGDVMDRTIECASVPGESAWYVVTLCCCSAFGEPALGHASPFFVECDASLL